MPTPQTRQNGRVRNQDSGHDFTVSYQQKHIKCGKDVCHKCRDGKGHGPYWYAFWREGQKIRSRYIGKQFKALWELPEFSKS